MFFLLIMFVVVVCGIYLYRSYRSEKQRMQRMDRIEEAASTIVNTRIDTALEDIYETADE